MGVEKNIKEQIRDEKFIERLCTSTWETIYRFIYFKVQNREEAEDITQETYIKAIEYINKNNIEIDNFIGFLKTIALNIFRDRWRKSKNRGTELNIENIKPEETSVDDHTEAVVQREFIGNALMLLNEEQRTVVDLRILKGFSVADTAKKMNKKESNIRVLQYRALKKLTEILKNT